MDNSEFKYPAGEHYDANNRERLDALRGTPEKLKTGPFELVQRAARTQFDRRAIAVAIEQKNGREVTIPVVNVKVVLPARPEAVVFESLVEAERPKGGAVFENGEAGGFMFWLDHKGSSVMGNEVFDWHLEVPNPYDIKKPYGVHIESTSHELRKFHKDGKSYPVTIQDIERFIPAVYHYMHVTADMYPFSQNFDDVIADIEIPDSIAGLVPPRPAEGDQSDYRLAA